MNTIYDGKEKEETAMDMLARSMYVPEDNTADWNGIGMTSDDVPEEAMAWMRPTEAEKFLDRWAENDTIAAKSWEKIYSLMPDFITTALWGVIHDRFEEHTDPVIFAQSVEELALYIELTGHVPADPEIFFDFGGAE